MKKLSTILACVIIAIAMLIPQLTSNNIVTAEAIETTKSTEATTEQKSKTTKKSSKSTAKKVKKVKPYYVYVKVKEAKVRENPGHWNKLIKTHSKGKKLKVRAKYKKWRKIGTHKWIHKSKLSRQDPYDYYQGVRLQYSAPYNITSHKLNTVNGRIYYNGHTETWYSIYEPGQTVTARSIPGKHYADDGTVRDKDGYICVATSQSYLSYYSRLMTSLGPAKVYDCGVSGSVVDIYTTWR